MQPAVHEVKRELGGEGGLQARRECAGVGMAGDLAEGGVGGDADFTGDAEGRVTFKRDHVGDRRIVEEVGVKLGEGFVGKKNERQFAGRAAVAKFLRVLVEGGDGARDGAPVDAQTRVAVGEGKGTVHGKSVSATATARERPQALTAVAVVVLSDG